MDRPEYVSYRGTPVYGGLLLNKMLESLCPKSTVLNVGVGGGLHSFLFMNEGHKVIGISPKPSHIKNDQFTFIRGLIEDVDIPTVDAIWSSMTIEHSQNVGMFLTKCRESVKPGGWFGVVAPTDKNDLVVDGHLNFWTPVSLLYNMVIAGWDCKNAKWYTKGRDIGLMVQRVDRPDVELVYDGGDLEKLQPYFPVPVIPRDTNPWLKDNI